MVVFLLSGLWGCGTSRGLTHEVVVPREASPKLAPDASTLDARIQDIVREELARTVDEWTPKAAVAIVIESSNGHVLALEGLRGKQRDPSIGSGSSYVTGSTLKSFTYAAALEAKTIDPDTMLDCRKRTYGTVEFHDHVPHETLSARDALATSSNVAASRVYETIDLARLVSTYKRFHIGESPGKLPVPEDEHGLAAANLSAGELAEATPLQMAAAYAALFNGGVYFPPTLTDEERPSERVVSAATAHALEGMLEYAVTSDIGTGKLARVEGMRVAGKTGTAVIGADEHFYASFIGTVLDQTPRLVILVALDAPKEGGTGRDAAAPAFSRIAKRLYTVEAAQ